MDASHSLFGSNLCFPHYSNIQPNHTVLHMNLWVTCSHEWNTHKLHKYLSLWPAHGFLVCLQSLQSYTSRNLPPPLPNLSRLLWLNTILVICEDEPSCPLELAEKIYGSWHDPADLIRYINLFCQFRCCRSTDCFYILVWHNSFSDINFLALWTTGVFIKKSSAGSRCL